MHEAQRHSSLAAIRMGERCRTLAYGDSATHDDSRTHAVQATSECAATGQEAARIRAHFVVGADGVHSFVRKAIEDSSLPTHPPSPVTQVVSALPGPPPEPPAGRVADIRRWSPSGQPKVAIQILQWSTNNARRFAYVSLDGGRATQVREGDQIGTLKVTRIYREVIEFGHDGGSFLLRAN